MNKNSAFEILRRLILLSAALTFLAFVVLPWASTLPPVQSRIEFNNERQINGGATFYTDHAFLMDLLAERESSEE